jgi:hypothetical protein
LRILNTKWVLVGLSLSLLFSCGSEEETTDLGSSTDSGSIQDSFVVEDTAPLQDVVNNTDPGQDVKEDSVTPEDISETPDESQEPDVPPFSCGSEPDGTPCDDGNPATVNDACYSGVCSGELSPEGWHYQFQGEIQGRFSRLRFKQTIDPDIEESWTPWITTHAEWTINYINSNGPPGFYPAYNIQVINECATTEQTSAFINAQLWGWYSIEETFAKDGFLILKNEKGEEEVSLQAFEVKWTSYMPEFGNCFSEEALEFEAAKLMLGNPE